MAVSFSTLPVIDLSLLSEESPDQKSLLALSKQLFDVFATTGFAYMINAPLSLSHDEVFQLAKNFFSMDMSIKMGLAKKTFVKTNSNTYRGYFPPQSGELDNLKEGFEIGTSEPHRQAGTKRTWHFDLAEGNVWPSDDTGYAEDRRRLELLHTELQALSAKLLWLLAVSLGQTSDHFSPYLNDSLSTLRLLHYPPQPAASYEADKVKLCCTPHTDSGILTLLHQDPTGGLEVLNAGGEWVPAPYIPGSIVVNIGDLMAEVSGGRLVATMHRVRASRGRGDNGSAMGRLSVPFFFEPGEACQVRSVNGGTGCTYSEHVRRKMSTWVEFQDVPQTMVDVNSCVGKPVEAW